MIDLLNRVADQWYRVPSPVDPLAQGDQFWGIVVREARDGPTGSPVVTPIMLDLVVLSQSCDLMYEKIDSVLCAPVHPLGDWIERNPTDLGRLEDIRQGFDPSLYILPAWPAAPYAAARVDRVIDFTTLRTVDLETLDRARATGTGRVALQSPMREHVAQAIARAFMRVGLPIDVPSFALERSGRQEATFSAIPDIVTVLRAENLDLTQPIPITISQRKRSSTGEIYFIVTTRLPEHRPQIVGAGVDLPQAQRSFAYQLIDAWRALGDEQTGTVWLRDYLTSSL